MTVLWTITMHLARRLDAFDTWSLRKNPSDPEYSTRYQRFCQGDYRLPSSLQYHWNKNAASLLWPVSDPLLLASWRVQIPGKIMTELSVRRSDHQETGGDLEGARVPHGWGGLMLMYSRLTSVSTQLVLWRRIIDTLQQSIRGTPLKKKREIVLPLSN